jgi:hypothetical protein
MNNTASRIGWLQTEVMGANYGIAPVAGLFLGDARERNTRSNSAPGRCRKGVARPAGFRIIKGFLHLDAPFRSASYSLSEKSAGTLPR